MKGWIEYLRKIRKVLLFCLVCVSVFGIVLFLYDIPLEPLIYGTAICAVTGAAALVLGYQAYMTKKKNLLYIKENVQVNLSKLLPPGDGNEEIYQDLLREMDAERKSLENSRNTFLPINGLLYYVGPPDQDAHRGGKAASYGGCGR